MSDLYPIMKGKAYRLAETIIAPKHHGEDLLRTIMSDSDESRQPLFLAMLPQVIPAKAHRQILLDGLARLVGQRKVAFTLHRKRVTLA